MRQKTQIIIADGDPRRPPSFVGFQPASVVATEVMRANKRQDTRHEILLRRELWKLGLRYRKNANAIVGKPDIVFGGARVVVFCDGDFWHGRDWRKLRNLLSKRHNAAYWLAKIGSNRLRDRRNTTILKKQGWVVLRFWESEILHHASAIALQVHQIVRDRQSSA